MTSDDNREKKYISFSANDIPMQLADLIDQRNTALKENKELKMRIKELEEECREANASWCREIEENIDLNRELTAAKQRIAELEPDFRVPAQLLREEREELRTKLAAMREQRDEARREVCDMVARTRRKMGVRGQIVGMDRVAGEEVAAERGWDCFAQQDGGGA